MNQTIFTKKCGVRLTALGLLLLIGLSSLIGCAQEDEIPEGYQYATCNGAYYRLFIPTQWKSTVESGISGGIYSTAENATVSMIRGREVHALDENSPDISAWSGTEETEDKNDETDAKDVQEETALHYALLCAEQYQTSLKRYRQNNLKTTVMGRRAAARLEYSALVGETEYSYFQVFAKHKGYFYVFTYAAPTAYYESRREMAEEILSYVTFTETAFESDNLRTANDGATAPEGMRLISGDEVAYRFYAPLSWQVDPNMGQSAVYYAEDDRSNITVSGHMPAEENLTMGSYKEQTIEEYKALFDTFTLLSDTSAQEETKGYTVDGKSAIRIVYEATLGGQAYKVDQTMILHGAMVYLITYTATPENFDLHIADLEAVLEAFVFR